MPTYEGSGDPASIALRLKRVEAILENHQPGDDAPSNGEAFGRLYDMTLRGGMHTGGDVTADMVDGMFWFRKQSLESRGYWFRPGISLATAVRRKGVRSVQPTSCSARGSRRCRRRTSPANRLERSHDGHLPETAFCDLRRRHPVSRRKGHITMQQQQDYRILAEALGSSLKQTCRNKGLDVQMAASRHVVDRVLYHWSAGFGRSVKMVKGGCMFDQSLRPTSDLDLVTPMRWTEDELQKGFERIADRLLAEGIQVNMLKIRQLALDEVDPVVRVDIQALCGTLRGNTHVDITSTSGPFAWPQEPPRQQLPSLLPKQYEGAVVHVQPLAAAAAEKWIAVLTKRHDDFRAKHALDLLAFREMDVDPDAIAVELLRVGRHRRIPLSFFAPQPVALEWVSYLLRGESWIKTAARRNFDDFDLLQSYKMLEDYWARTHQALTRAVIAQVRRDNRVKPSLIDRLAARQHQDAPAYRPQQPTP